MPVICEHCGKKMDKFCVIKYDKEYLLEYLTDYFDRDVWDAGNKNIIKMKEKDFRAIVFYVMHEFGSVSPTILSEMFGVSNKVIYSDLKRIEEKNTDDFKFICKELSGTLPETEKLVL